MYSNDSLVTGQGGAQGTAAAAGNHFGRADTLERNPGCVDPAAINPQQAQLVQQQQQVQKQEPEPSKVEVASPHEHYVIEPEEQKPQEMVVVQTQAQPQAIPQQQIIVNDDNTVTLVTTDEYWGVEDVGIGGEAGGSPTGPNPSMATWPGQIKFQAKFLKLSQSSKETWDVSGARIRIRVIKPIDI